MEKDLVPMGFELTTFELESLWLIQMAIELGQTISKNVSNWFGAAYSWAEILDIQSQVFAN